jgi:DNA-binding MarR family transcriptional regulator
MERYSSPIGPAQHHTTLAEWRVLTHLFSCSPTTVTELRTRLCADKAEVSRACSSLITKGYIIQRPDPSDARSTLLIVTPSGIDLHNRILPLRQILEDELAAALTAQESTMLHQALDKLIQYLSTSNGGAARKPRLVTSAGPERSAGRESAKARREFAPPSKRERSRH